MRPVPLIACVAFCIVSLLHLARMLLHVEVEVGGTTIAMWPSAVGFVAAGALAVLLFRDARKP